MIDTEEITATYVGEDRVEVGIQACTYRKPGRKPKSLKTETPEGEGEEGEKEEELEKDEEGEDIIEKDLVLEIRRYTSFFCFGHLL